jgi:hypothetical protein
MPAKGACLVAFMFIVPGAFASVTRPSVPIVAAQAAADIPKSTTRSRSRRPEVDGTHPPALPPLGGSYGSSLQQQAQAAMKRLLMPGLFSFVEPSPSRGYEG